MFDCGVLIHELMHYDNEPKHKRNLVSDMLTETISYSVELIFFQELKEEHQDDYNWLNRVIEYKIYLQQPYTIQ